MVTWGSGNWSAAAPSPSGWVRPLGWPTGMGKLPVPSEDVGVAASYWAAYHSSAEGSGR